MIILRKLKQISDVNKFSWAEAFNDKNGKTSWTAIASAIVVIGSMFVFVVTGIACLFSIANATTVCGWSVATLTLGMSAVGVNKVMQGKPEIEDTIVDPDIPDNKTHPPVTN